MYNPPDVTTMTTSSTSRDYDLYDQQIMREEQRDTREGRNESREWPEKQDYTDDNFLDSRSRFDDRDDNNSNVNDEYYNNNSPSYDRNDMYDFDMRRRRQQLEPQYDDDDYAQMRKSRYPRRISNRQQCHFHN
jgi:hypothetical protein